MYFKCNFKKNYSIQNGRIPLKQNSFIVIHLNMGGDFQFPRGASKQTKYLEGSYVIFLLK